MSTFDDRENAFENKFAHDAEMQFKADARRNKLLGLWAAKMMGKSEDDANAYVKEVIKSDFEEAGHEDVVRKVAGDLGDESNPDEIRTIVIRQRADQMGRNGIGAIGRKQQRIAIRARPRDRAMSDGARCAGAIIHHELLAKNLAETLRKKPRHGVG